MDSNIVKIIEIIATTDSSLDGYFFDSVLQRLSSLGYSFNESDLWVLCFSAQKVEKTIMNSCNSSKIPDGLIFTAVDMICGDFLFTKKSTGTLTGFSFEDVVKSIQEGDTNITFAGGLSDEQKFDQLISQLRTPDESQFVSYRQMRW